MPNFLAIDAKQFMTACQPYIEGGRHKRKRFSQMAHRLRAEPARTRRQDGRHRTTIQNWEAQVGELSTITANGVKIWDQRLRQEEPLRGPVTLIYADAPMMLSSQGPQRVAMMQQESHLSNAAVLCRV
jgi:hypothetical protein